MARNEKGTWLGARSLVSSLNFDGAGSHLEWENGEANLPYLNFVDHLGDVWNVGSDLLSFLPLLR